MLEDDLAVAVVVLVQHYAWMRTAHQLGELSTACPVELSPGEGVYFAVSGCVVCLLTAPSVWGRFLFADLLGINVEPLKTGILRRSYRNGQPWPSHQL